MVRHKSNKYDQMDVLVKLKKRADQRPSGTVSNMKFCLVQRRCSGSGSIENKNKEDNWLIQVQYFQPHFSAV